MKRNKIGRNDSCPCGSGKKFKHCHGILEPRQTYTDFFSRPMSSPSISPNIRAPVSTVFNKERFVAVGSRLYHSAKWLTFHDFLMDYIKICLGSDWGNAELQKPIQEMHPIIQWYRDQCDFQKTASENASQVVYKATATGSVAAYMAIAYELYLLEHHQKLQQKLLARLKDHSQFQGARYELYVAALFLKAGLQIDYQDEDDRSTTHCEFNAFDSINDRSFSVEAKSRHRPGFLGYPGLRQDPETIKLRIGELLNDAIAKEADHYRLILVDVNMPPEDQQNFGLSWFKPLAKTLSEIEKRTQERAIVFLTNVPNHYVGSAEIEPSRNFFMSAINEPTFKQPDISTAASAFPSAMLLWKAMNDYETVPHTF